MSDNPDKSVELSRDEKALLVEEKATCPFVGSAVAQGKLVVRNNAKDPLASIEDIRGLGNTGGGDLGDLLVVFASGNHAFMQSNSGRLDKPVPNGLFSLEFPGSQGSHPPRPQWDSPGRSGNTRFRSTERSRFCEANANEPSKGWLDQTLRRRTLYCGKSAQGSEIQSI